MSSAWGNGCALVWPNGADIAPGVLYDWLQHVDAIVQRRRQRFALEKPVLVRVQPESALGWTGLCAALLRAAGDRH